MAEPKPLRADARRNRAAIIAAARSVFDQGESLRFDDFAARAGVGVGTLYRHFPTRAALAAAVYKNEVTALCDQASDSTQPPGMRLEMFLHAFVDYVVEHAALARALAADVDSSAQAEGGSQLERTLTDLIAGAAAEGAIRCDVTPGAVLIALHGIGSAIDRPQWATESRIVVGLIVRGLGFHAQVDRTGEVVDPGTGTVAN
ncbi:TetR/AcrR family transcriptional regulator [Curtobacterium sp. VKM Ac-2887]|uniref:TetR/AcrR family transcriptional regulator n=1 Tax=Curtobacterium sp. VKM Ac-2887 TaxID=2783819 RepID=UPI00188A5D07|nr:TetR/AcrR family transcriptional regulator [Curtobacterium sp. VKM Ac-2887]MBF4588225.1 TetR/AcrR family transcriptional regulator [Curtobacterium sp. VKM Ac-2887]